MKTEGPLLESLTHRLQECPAAFLEEPMIGDSDGVVVAAVVADLVRSLKGDPLLRPKTNAFVSKKAKERNRLRLVLVASWLLHDPWFRAKELGETALRFLGKDLRTLATLVDAEQFVADPDRREELARYALSRLGFRPKGETEAQARDHLSTLDIPIWWGPGRHGPGNNLFLMFKDPHGHPVELSAEIEHIPRHAAPRLWPHTEQTVNLWGSGWIRD